MATGDSRVENVLPLYFSELFGTAGYGPVRPLTVPPQGNERSESGVVWGRGELMLPATRFACEYGRDC